MGGVFGQSREYQERHSNAPEIVLASGLRAEGWDVTTVGHNDATVNDSFDVVHVHHAGRAAYMFASASNRSKLVFTGHNGRMLTGAQISWAKRRAFRFVVRRSDAAVALTSTEEKYLRPMIGDGFVRVIPNGVQSLFYQPVSEEAEDRAGLLYVGQLSQVKGVDILLKAFARLPVEAGTLTLAYHNATLERELKRLASELGIEQRVRFVGAKPPVDLAVLYRRARALVLPSYAESLPSVITEAMLAGTPVVASAVGGIVEQLAGFGRTVRPGDVGDLTEALTHILAHPPSQVERGAMQEQARTRYTVPAMIRAHAKLYREVVARRRTRSPIDPLAIAVRGAIPLYWGAKSRSSKCG